MPEKEKNEKKEASDEVKELIVARLEVMPSDRKLSIGSEGEFTRDELIEHVKKGDKIGKKITEIQLEYLRLLKENIFYEQDTANHKA